MSDVQFILKRIHDAIVAMDLPPPLFGMRNEEAWELIAKALEFANGRHELMRKDAQERSREKPKTESAKHGL